MVASRDRSRPGQWSQRRARERRWAAVRRGGWRLALVAGTFLAVGVLLGLLVGGALGGVYFGVFASSAFWAPALIVEQVSGASAPAMGAAAEEWTSRELHKARLRSAAVFDRISFQANDIDHAVVTPSAALAVETKWRSDRWTAEPPDTRLLAATRQAHGQARQLGTMLHSVDFDLQVPVSPIVVVWGQHAWERGTAVEVNGCPVIAGSDLRPWIQDRLATEALSATPAFESAIEALRRYQQKRDRHEEATSDLPLIVRDGAGHVGWAITEVALAFLVSVFATTTVVRACSGALGTFVLLVPLVPTLVGLWLRRRRPLLGWGLAAGGLSLILMTAAIVAKQLL